MQKNNQADVRHTLLSNGLDFVEFSIDGMRSNDLKKVKYSILHLYAGLALILKERIHVEHWALVFSRPEKINKKKYEEGDFESISLDKTVSLLTEICGISFDKEDSEAIEILRKTRNKIEHFGFEVSKESIKPVFAKVLNFIVNFVEVNLEGYVESSEEQEIFEEIKDNAKKLSEYVKERIAYAEKYSHDSKKDIFHCPECREKALVREQDDYKCFACGTIGADSTDVAVTHLEEGLGMYYDPTCDWPLHDCPECGHEQVLVLWKDDNSIYKCVSCGETINGENLESCSSCGQVYYVPRKEEDFGCCSGCWERSMSKD